MIGDDVQLRVVLSDGYFTLLEAGHPLPEASQVLAAVRVRGLSPRTTRAYAFDLLHFYRWLTEPGF